MRKGRQIACTRRSPAKAASGLPVHVLLAGSRRLGGSLHPERLSDGGARVGITVQVIPGRSLSDRPGARSDPGRGRRSHSDRR